jgi:hypothetical protein
VDRPDPCCFWNLLGDLDILFRQLSIGILNPFDLKVFILSYIISKLITVFLKNNNFSRFISNSSSSSIFSVISLV